MENINYIPPVAVNYGGNVGSAVQQKALEKGDVPEAITSLFMQTMLKEIYKNQFKNGLFQGEGDVSSSYFSDVFIDQLINEMAATDAFGIKKMIEEDMRSKSQDIGGGSENVM